MNGGGIASNGEPSTTPVYSFTNGAWTTGSPHVYTPTSGNPSLTVSVGDWANVFTDGSTTPVFIGRVTAVSSTTISVSSTAKGGTAPTTAGTGISINVGGAWAGPSGTVGFPFTFLDTAMQSSTTARPCVNLKNDQTYNITSTINSGGTSPYRFQGYSTTFADGGRATIDGGTSGASYTLLNVANIGSGVYADLIFQNNGATGSTGLVNCTNTNSTHVFYRCVAHDSRGSGFSSNGNSAIFWIECEAYNCNKATGGNRAGFDNGSGVVDCMALRCISHDNTGYGFNAVNNCLHCIADTNTLSGYFVSASNSKLINCDAYNNTQHGMMNAIGSTQMIYFENCNLIKNGQWGISLAQGATAFVTIYNCGFGTGTQANTSGTIQAPSAGSYDEFGTVSYGSGLTPWVDPANGDFRINLAAAKNSGRGAYTETAASYAGTIAYPDIGAAQHLDSGGSSGPIGQLKQFNRGNPY